MAVGAGFGGLGAANRLSREPVDVLLIDRNDRHLFQPLLCQVAAAALSLDGIASPIPRPNGNRRSRPCPQPAEQAESPVEGCHTSSPLG